MNDQTSVWTQEAFNGVTGERTAALRIDEYVAFGALDFHGTLIVLKRRTRLTQEVRGNDLRQLITESDIGQDVVVCAIWIMQTYKCF